MFNKLLSLSLFSVFAVFASPTYNVKLVNTGNDLTAPGTSYEISPYEMKIDGVNTDVVCIDPFHWSNTNTYTANITNLGSVSSTPDGLSSTYLDNATEYEEEAYLISLAESASASDAQRIEAQVADWNLLYSNAKGSNFVDVTSSSFKPYLQGYDADLTAAAESVGHVNYAEFNIVSQTGQNPSEQEFMFMAPEPGSMALLGSGLFLFGVFARRKTWR
jgi:hypothetical protein